MQLRESQDTYIMLTRRAASAKLKCAEEERKRKMAKGRPKKEHQHEWEFVCEVGGLVGTTKLYQCKKCMKVQIGNFPINNPQKQVAQNQNTGMFGMSIAADLPM